MAEPLPIVLVPGLLTSPRLYANQLPALWQHGPVTIADNTRDDTMAAIAGRILADAPPRFALAGLSMGGYICFEIVRQAPDRVDRLALLDTSARPDTPEVTERRQAQIALARGGRLGEVADQQFPPADPPLPPRRPSHPGAGPADGRRDRGRGVHPPATGDHRPGRLAARARRHRLPDAGAGRRRRPADPTRVVGRDRRGHPGGAPGGSGWLRSPDPLWTSPRRSPRRWWSGSKPEHPCGTRRQSEGSRTCLTAAHSREHGNRADRRPQLERANRSRTVRNGL